MTSEAPGECFVYITLPGETAPVTAGRFALTVDRRGVAGWSKSQGATCCWSSASTVKRPMQATGALAW